MSDVDGGEIDESSPAFYPNISQIIFPAVNILIVGFSCQENVYLFRWMNMYVYT